jgi:drug/metabolite transporter (DMT)-like permease
MVAVQQKPILTAALTVAALIAFAANSVLCRLALGTSAIDPASYTAVRLITGAVTLSLIVQLLPYPTAEKSAASWVTATMLFLYAVTFSFAYVSLSTGTGALILFAAVQITMVGIGLYAGERPRAAEWVGLSIALAGLVYLVFPGLTAPSPVGSFLMSVAGIAWGGYSLRGRNSMDPVRATTDNFLRTLPFAVAVILFWLSSLAVSPMGFVWAATSGSVSSGIGYVIWYAALRGLTATRAATVQLSVPVIAAVGGVVLLSEETTLRLVISAVAILGGVGVAVSSRKPPGGS